MTEKVKLKEVYFVAWYQHGYADTTSMGKGFESLEEAEAHAISYLEGPVMPDDDEDHWGHFGIKYDDKTAHEIVIFKAIKTYRGKIGVKNKKGRGGLEVIPEEFEVE